MYEKLGAPWARDTSGDTRQECIDRWVRVKPTRPLDNMRLEDMLAAQSSVSAGGGAPAHVSGTRAQT